MFLQKAVRTSALTLTDVGPDNSHIYIPTGPREVQELLTCVGSRDKD